MDIITMLIVILLFGIAWGLIAKFVGLPQVVNVGLTIVFIILLIICIAQMLGIQIPHAHLH